MCSKRTLLLLVIVSLTVLIVSSANIERQSRSFLSRLNLSLLGLGPRCRGCPTHYCDDDPALVLGYCCGCARYFGKSIPIVLSTTIFNGQIVFFQIAYQ
ncbi:unnamed protein product [Acanthoscelides obtectus]|uniref:Uncharacterized protein n=1 Tax=Acanthoscelides obtectus TaxID=200917 RepID=A0A9P0PIK6_ACAOB|nr:unnamed protein product [Acanthoscelides obtectus]CAK1659826.1 hypothetical protein AOBTE_LOCUS21695 [Acanthoscelides obtectus]